MKPHAFQVLLALSETERHATGIARRVRERSDGAIELWPVTLHRTLDRLEEDGLIAELSGPGEHPEGASRKRRYYRLTKDGAAALAVEAERLRAFAAAARRNLDNERWRP